MSIIETSIHYSWLKTYLDSLDLMRSEFRADDGINDDWNLGHCEFLGFLRCIIQAYHLLQTLVGIEKAAVFLLVLLAWLISLFPQT